LAWTARPVKPKLGFELRRVALQDPRFENMFHVEEEVAEAWLESKQ
jgi:hypothetical protein